MKKNLLLVVFLSVSAFSFAQKGSFGTEVYFRPWNAQNVFTLIDGLKARYFVTDNIAVRAVLGYTRTGGTAYSTIAIGANTNMELKTVSSNSSFTFNPGVEYQFKTFNKVALYAGVEGHFNLRSDLTKNTNDQDDDYTLTKNQNGSTAFGVALFTGLDYRLTEHFYVGTELGLSYTTESARKRKDKAVVSGQTTETTVENKDRTSSFATFVLPSIRLGWTF
ncbi:MAG: outer membrane beta-barrel protein [Prevotellaceae bacterium]|jgi:outer membrane protein W|nr:outer membrane beta-barrel protein [Prevotellaceae bacterium]